MVIDRERSLDFGCRVSVPGLGCVSFVPPKTNGLTRPAVINQGMYMIAYLILLLAAVVVAYLAIRFYRLIADSRVPEVKMVALSDSRGQWRLQRQKGFVQSDRPGAAQRRTQTAKKGSVRKPWGW